MQCREFLAGLEAEQMTAAAVAHLDQCARCSALLADLRAIESAAVGLAEVEPPQRVWGALRNQLEAEKMIREPEVELVLAGSRPTFWTRWRPALAAAYLTALVAVSSLFALRIGPTQPALTGAGRVAGVVVTVPEELVPASDALPEIRERNPVVTASYRKSLEIIDNFILLCEKSIREEPNNELAREYLYDAYQQKADLLAMSADRGAWGD